MAVKKQFGSFEELIQSSDTPILVDFYAPWCGPCQLMAGILEQLSTKVQDKAQVVKINTDTYPALASQYRISALPTLVIFKNGAPVDRIEGAMPIDKLYDRLMAWI